MTQAAKPPNSPLASVSDIQSRAVVVAEMLTVAFRSLVGAIPGGPSRPMDVARALGVNKNLTHRVTTALNESEPLAALLAMPGPGPLQRMADRASELGVGARVCQEARDAARRFDDLIRSVAGDRTLFDAMVSEWVPAARSQVDAAARQSVYRGMRQILGVSAETKFNVCIFKRSETVPGRVDFLDIDGQLGVRRIQSGGRLFLTISSNLLGHSAGSPTTRSVLTEFCSAPPPTFKIVGPSSRSVYEIEWNDTLGRASARDVVIGEMRRGAFLLERPKPEEVYTGLADCMSVPARRFVSDVLFHRDVYKGAIPVFRVLTTGDKGIVMANDQSHDHERIKIDAEIQAIPEGRITEVPTPEVPFYRRLIESQTAAAGWDIRAFRAFRICFDYPIFDSQMQWLIPLPEAGSGG